MKENEIQTPRKEHPRSSDLVNRRSKDSVAKKTSKKVAKKSLAEVFTSPVKEVLLEISEEESIDFSSISDSNVNDETAESFVMAPYPSISASPETCISGLTSCSKISAANGDEHIDFPKTRSAEVEIVVNFLKQAGQETLNSVDVEENSKKVLDALIKFIINEFYTLPQERDMLAKFFPGNAYVGYLCFLLGVVAILLLSFYLFYYSTVAHSCTRLPPT